VPLPHLDTLPPARMCRRIRTCRPPRLAGVMRQPVSACISAISRPLHGLSLPVTDLRGRHPFWMKSHARLRAVNSRRPTAARPREGKSRNSADARNGPARPPPTAAWQDRYPAIVKLWRARWDEFTPSLTFPPEVRRVIYTTNLSR
jgi:hypothetical protein